MAVRFCISPSIIHGLGVFAQENVKKDTVVGIVVYKDRNAIKITEDFGIFVNHSFSPNSKLKFINNNELALVTTEDVEKGQEFVADYNDETNPFFISRFNG